MKKIIIGFALALSLAVAPQRASASLLGDFVNWITPPTKTASDAAPISSLLARLSPASPLEKTLNTATPQSRITLAIFGLKSSVGEEIKKVTLAAPSVPEGVSNFIISNGTKSLLGVLSSSRSSIIFEGSLIVPPNTWQDFSVTADVAKGSVGDIKLSLGSVTSQPVENQSSPVVITGITPVKGTVTTPTSGVWLNAYPSISFTVNNVATYPIYMSKNPNMALATTTSYGANASTTVTSTTASGSTTGDTVDSYIINGSRTFTYNLFVDNTSGSGTSKKISITRINYGTGSGAANDDYSVTDGLATAYVQVP